MGGPGQAPHAADRARILAEPSAHDMPRVKGERRLEILKVLAQMLGEPRWASYNFV